ncbi:M4 family metallopeptidase [Pedobacter gandavensis]|uniref:M4 family metallopeptidase n=1 Tax=Pedobacter gandavensis TaxID=2679963 RepID=UPI00292F825C|nr:M4 family metallopeptidase [Pedobacter gandavensis]
MMNKIMDTNTESSAFKHAVFSSSNDNYFRSRRKFLSKLKPEAQMMLMDKSFQQEAGKPTVNREVYTAGHKKKQPGTLLRSEGGKPVEDKDVNHVYDAAGYTWDFYNTIFSRNSIDNKGLKLIQTVHYDSKYNNAFWDGQQMVYGDGDGKIFGSFTSDIDIIGHELTHGIVQYECNLAYKDQSGALNESLADIFGIMIKQKTLNQDVTQSNWLIGENVLNGKDYALRSLKAPGTAYVNHPEMGTDPQPNDMSGYVNDPFDSGGVHYNSSIPNHAFYVAAFNTGGYAWEKIGRIWYAAMCDKALVSETCDFAFFKAATLFYAAKLFPGDTAVLKNVQAGWQTVGL